MAAGSETAPEAGSNAAPTPPPEASAPVPAKDAVGAKIGAAMPPSGPPPSLPAPPAAVAAVAAPPLVVAAPAAAAPGRATPGVVPGVVPKAVPEGAPEASREASREAPPRPAGPGLLVIAKANDTLRSLYERVYRGLQAPPFEVVAAMNPRDIRLGDVVVFPAPTGGWKRLTGLTR